MNPVTDAGMARRDRFRAAARIGAALLALGACVVVAAHGNVTPQPVDTTGLAPLATTGAR